MARVPVRVFVAEVALAEVDAARDSGVDHPLQRAVDGRAADPAVLRADQLDELVRAEVPFLLHEEVDDDVALARTAAAGGPMLLNELGSRGNRHSSGIAQALNDEPHPQVDLAFGFLMVKPPPMVLSTKSTSAPFEVPQADRVDEQPDAVDFEHLVGRGLALTTLVDHQPVLEAGTAAALHEDAQARAGFLFLGQELGDLVCRRFGHVNHDPIIAVRTGHGSIAAPSSLGRSLAQQTS